ncbi:hypothetical protein G5I_10713 [Acromyrmex echinatior]|uniref:Uncharacterized protein n=1 Tax=Acromyrmex echinatior TaxID=103372 RepID=F4WXM7_ACREC|nr:hypothetical protein G5I_10713 [Acromyrmex echinatior]
MQTRLLEEKATFSDDALNLQVMGRAVEQPDGLRTELDIGDDNELIRETSFILGSEASLGSLGYHWDITEDSRDSLPLPPTNIPYECEVVGKSALESLGICHCDCPSDALRGRRISFDELHIGTYPISWGQLTMPRFFSFAATMVGVCETRAAPSDNELTELKKGPDRRRENS